MRAQPTIVFPALFLMAITACGSSKSDSDKGSAAVAASASGEAAGATTAPGASAPSAAMGTAATPADLANVFEGDWADRMLGIMLEKTECADRIAPLEAFAQEAAAAGQRVWQAESLAAAAACLSSEGRPEEAVARLSSAVDLGYSDCYFLRSDDNLKKLADQPGYRALLDRIKTSLADAQETSWIVAEYSAIFHDTSMMITEEMNRLDSEMTKVPQSEIPSRPTTNQSVVAARAMLRAVQGYQRAMVMQGDQQRVQHNTSMGIINSMGDGTGGGSTDTKVMQSRMFAADAAGNRRRAMEARAFKLTSPTEVVVCSSIPD